MKLGLVKAFVTGRNVMFDVSDVTKVVVEKFILIIEE
jgi:hypothetical protein